MKKYSLLILMLFLFFLPIHVFGAVAYVNSVKNTTGAALTTGWNVTAGNVLIVRIYYTNGGTPTLGISNNRSESFTLLESVSNYAASHAVYGVVLANGGANIQITPATGWSSLSIEEYSGSTITKDVTDVTATANNNNISQQTITTATNGDLILTTWCMQTGGASSVTSSIGTNVQSALNSPFGNSWLSNYYIQTTAGALNQTVTFNPGYNTGNASMSLIALKASGGYIQTPANLFHKIVFNKGFKFIIGKGFQFIFK